MNAHDAGIEWLRDINDGDLCGAWAGMSEALRRSVVDVLVWRHELSPASRRELLSGDFDCSLWEVMEDTILADLQVYVHPFEPAWEAIEFVGQPGSMRRFIIAIDTESYRLFRPDPSADSPEVFTVGVGPDVDFTGLSLTVVRERDEWLVDTCASTPARYTDHQ